MKFRWSAVLLPLIWGASPAFGYEEAALIEVARRNVEAAVRGEKPPATDDDESARGVFVTIERGGKILGCRGNLRPRAASLQGEVALAARSAARTDPRYRPLAPGDLRSYLVTVTVVEKQTPLSQSDIASLQPGEGLVLQSGNKTGVVLPWEGRDPHVRLGWAYKKAGVSPGASCRLYRLEAARFRG